MSRMQSDWTVIGLIVCALVGISHCGCGRTSVASIPPNIDRVKALRDSMGGGASADAAGGSVADGGAQPTGWATLKGRFRITGASPARLAMNISKDTAVCAPGGKQQLSEEVIIGKEDGIKNVVIFLSQAIPAEEPWSHPDMAPGKTEEILFDQKECVFLSHVLPMQTSQKLKILNSDSVGHNTKLSPKKNKGFDRTVAAGGTAFYEPSKEEPSPFSVVCAVHPWMNAHVMIRDNSYVAVTGDDGSFEIPNLPAGVELEFRVWQEKAKFLSDVSVNGQSTSWKKGRVVMTLDSGDLSKNELDVVVDGAVFN